MPVLPTKEQSVEERVRAELQVIKAQVTGVHGSLVATSDGLLVAHDVPDLDAAQIAALVATTRALATSTTLATGRGEFREALARGNLGYLAVYAAGDTAIVAVIGNDALNLGMLHYQAREVIERIAQYAPHFRQWGASVSGDGGVMGDVGPGSDPGVLPVRRTRAS